MAEKQKVIVSIEPALLDKEAAQLFLGGISATALDRLCVAKKITRRLIGRGSVRFRVSELRSYVESCPESDIPPPPNCGYGRAGKPTEEAMDSK